MNQTPLIMGILTALLYGCVVDPQEFMHGGKFIFFLLTHFATINGLRTLNNDELSSPLFLVTDLAIMFGKSFLLQVICTIIP
jgi:hypothetical protein